MTFTDTHSRIYRVIGGTVHLAAHWAAMFAIGWGALAAAAWVAPGVAVHALRRWSRCSSGTGGWLAGSFLTGLYLLVSLNVFGRHSEEAFSALRIQDYKNFLRLHIAPDGTLTIYPIKLPRVPRRWRTRATGGRDRTPSRLVPDEPLEPALIEPPIVLRKRMSALLLPPGPAATTPSRPARAAVTVLVVDEQPGPASSTSLIVIRSPRRRSVSSPIFSSALPGDSRRTQNGSVSRVSRFSRGSKARTWSDVSCIARPLSRHDVACSRHRSR